MTWSASPLRVQQRVLLNTIRRVCVGTQPAACTFCLWAARACNEKSRRLPARSYSVSPGGSSLSTSRFIPSTSILFLGRLGIFFNFTPRDLYPVALAAMIDFGMPRISAASSPHFACCQTSMNLSGLQLYVGVGMIGSPFRLDIVPHPDRAGSSTASGGPGCR